MFCLGHLGNTVWCFIHLCRLLTLFGIVIEHSGNDSGLLERVLLKGLYENREKNTNNVLKLADCLEKINAF